MITFNTALLYSTRTLLDIGIISARLDSQLLLSFTLEKPLTYILINLEKHLSHTEYEKFISLVSRRSQFEPIAYIIAQKEFYGYNFFVDNNVLIPRPSTELLIDIVLREYKSFVDDELHILDLGTGSGCIIITLLLKLPLAKGIGVDISTKALSVALKNSKAHNVNQRLELIQSNWFKNIPNQNYDIILANPPYIAKNEKTLMAKETLLFEPKDALFASNNGLREYKIISKSAKHYLTKYGKLFIEIGFNQRNDIVELFLIEGYQLTGVFQDLAGIDRTLIFHYNGS